MIEAQELEGRKLLGTLISLTGLPSSMVQKELEEILSQAGHSPDNLTLESLRAAMVLYLERCSTEADAPFPLNPSNNS